MAGTWNSMLSDIEAWYGVEYPRMVNAVALVVGDRTLAADAVGEAWTKALARWDRVRRMDRPGGWIYRVALNEAKRRARDASRESPTDVGDLSRQAATNIDVDVDVWNAVARLPARTRAAVILRYVADLTEPDIALALGVRRGTVATMLRRARERLAIDLGQQHRRHPAPEVLP